jgi:CO/xanthine dehydrogenase FAD-binding subunit
VVNGAATRVSLVIGGATPNPVRANAAEAALSGKAPSADNIAAAADQVAAAIKDPLGDGYADADYRVALARAMAKRALTEAAARAA